MPKDKKKGLLERALQQDAPRIGFVDGTLLPVKQIPFAGFCYDPVDETVYQRLKFDTEEELFLCLNMETYKFDLLPEDYSVEFVEATENGPLPGEAIALLRAVHEDSRSNTKLENSILWTPVSEAFAPMHGSLCLVDLGEGLPVVAQVLDYEETKGYFSYWKTKTKVERITKEHRYSIIYHNCGLRSARIE